MSEKKISDAYVEALQHVAAIEEIRLRRNKILGIKDSGEYLAEEKHWCYRETMWNKNLTTWREKMMYYNALLDAVIWGKKVEGYANK